MVQRLMDSVMRDLVFVFFFYLDDILVASSSAEERLSHTELVFKPLEDHDMIINPAKCQFWLPAIDFFGPPDFGTGVIPLPSKVQVVADAKFI